jgi:hypothetical protein
MKGRTLKLVWCGLACWRFGVWRAPRGARVIELGPVEVYIKRRSA